MGTQPNKIAFFVFCLFAVSGLTVSDSKAQSPQQELDQLFYNDQEVSELTTGTILTENELLNYCFNVSETAKEVRSAILANKIRILEEKLDQKRKALEVTIGELRNWTTERKEFLEGANKSLVQIYQSMRPDAAAQQLTVIRPMVAAAIIMKLKPKVSSAILTEMEPEIAAKIASVLTSAVKTEAQGNE